MEKPSASAKVIRAVVLTALFLWSAPYLFLYIFGRNIIIDHLGRITGKTVTAGSFSLTPALGMELSDIVISDVGAVKMLRVVPNALSLVSPQFVFNEISLVEPEFTLKRSAALLDVSQGSQEQEKVVSIKPPNRFRASWEFPIVVRRAAVVNGIVHWVDKQVSDAGLVATIDDINVQVKNFAAAFPAITQFEATGTIPWHHSSARGRLELSGWVNFNKNDIQARFSVSDIDAVDLQPYYRKYYDLDKARVEKANLSFSADMQGLDNDVNVRCMLRLSKVTRAVRGPDDSREKEERITDAVMGILKAVDGDNIHLEFTFKTRMDRPAFGLGIVKNAVETKLSRGRSGNLLKPEGVVLFPGRVLVGVVQGFTEVSKSLIGGGFAVGNEFRKAVSASFQKDGSTK